MLSQVEEMLNKSNNSVELYNLYQRYKAKLLYNIKNDNLMFVEHCYNQQDQQINDKIKSYFVNDGFIVYDGYITKCVFDDYHFRQSSIHKTNGFYLTLPNAHL